MMIYPWMKNASARVGSEEDRGERRSLDAGDSKRTLNWHSSSGGEVTLSRWWLGCCPSSALALIDLINYCGYYCDRHLYKKN